MKEKAGINMIRSRFSWKPSFSNHCFYKLICCTEEFIQFWVISEWTDPCWVHLIVYEMKNRWRPCTHRELGFYDMSVINNERPQTLRMQAFGTFKLFLASLLFGNGWNKNLCAHIVSKVPFNYWYFCQTVVKFGVQNSTKSYRQIINLEKYKPGSRSTVFKPPNNCDFVSDINTMWHLYIFRNEGAGVAVTIRQ